MVYFLYRLSDKFSRKFKNEFLHKGLYHKQFVSYCIIDIAASNIEIERIFLLTVPSWASVGLLVFRPTLIFFTHITDDRLHFFYMYLSTALLVRKRSFSVQHLLWHEASVNYGQPRGPVVLTPLRLYPLNHRHIFGI